MHFDTFTSLELSPLEGNNKFYRTTFDRMLFHRTYLPKKTFVWILFYQNNIFTDKQFYPTDILIKKLYKDGPDQINCKNLLSFY